MFALPEKELLTAVRAAPTTPPKRPARFLSLFLVLDHIMAFLGTTRTDELE
jgi:hypothetical protein